MDNKFPDFEEKIAGNYQKMQTMVTEQIEKIKTGTLQEVNEICETVITDLVQFAKEDAANRKELWSGLQ